MLGITLLYLQVRTKAVPDHPIRQLVIWLEENVVEELVKPSPYIRGLV